MIGFEWPWVFVLLPAPLLFRRHRRQNPETVPELPRRLRDSLLELGSGSRLGSAGQRILRTALWAFFLTAVAQPYMDGGATIQPASGRSIMLALDLSASMSTKDFTRSGELRTRLQAVKEVAMEFVSRREGDRVGLVLFGSNAFVASPLTFDTRSLNAVIESAEIGVAGRTTAIGQALGLGIRRLRNDPSAHKAIILVTDGHNNAGGVEPETAAQLASTLGIVVHTIGLGTEFRDAQDRSTEVDFETLKQIAASSGGKYFSAATQEDLEAVYEEIDQLAEHQYQAPPIILKRDIRNLFLIMALILVTALVVLERPLRRGAKVQ